MWQKFRLRRQYQHDENIKAALGRCPYFKSWTDVMDCIVKFSAPETNLISIARAITGGNLTSVLSNTSQSVYLWEMMTG